VGSTRTTNQASARDAQRLRDADLVVANGGGLEGGLHDALGAAEDDGVRVFTALDVADPMAAGEDEHGADAGGGDGHEHEGGLNPHFWQDPHRMAMVVRALGAELGTLDQPDAAALTAGAEAYATQLGRTRPGGGRPLRPPSPTTAAAW